ncbi:MAG TPA: CRTAC1 family protein, partial [Gemmataceae bacterium]|nr:CRTAC1 family protein [Gemmataceae bacterium]
GRPAPAPPTALGPAWYRDVTAGSGLDFTYRNGEEADQFTILESLGGGVALIDYDGDGLLDVFLTGGGTFGGPDHKDILGRPCKLYKNLGGWKFRDVTEEAGLGGPWWYTHGAAVADYDRDGWPDLLVTGYGRLALFHNEPDGKGGRKFVDVTEKLGLRDHAWSTSAGWADIDGDGWPDLYVCHYLDWSFDNNPPCSAVVPGRTRDVCPPTTFKPLVHALFHNEGGKSFRDVSAGQGFKAEGCGLGVVLADFNGDGRPDVYVADDGTNNLLFFNRGGRLEEKGVAAGAALNEVGKYSGSMGVDAGDYDGSGRPSLFVTNFEGELHGLYRNRGGETFQHYSQAAGVAAIGRRFVGFGTAFVDVDGDGWEDLVIVNGHVLRYPAAGSALQTPMLLHNGERQGRRFFSDAGDRGGPFFRAPIMGRGLAVGDLDNDGRPDLVVSRSNAPAVLLRNEAASEPAARWLGIRLVGRDRRDIVGSAAVLEVGEGRRLTRFAKGGGSYLSASDPRLLFGLGESGKPGRLTVRWSWGAEQSWDGLESGSYWELREGDPQARRL